MARGPAGPPKRRYGIGYYLGVAVVGLLAVSFLGAAAWSDSHRHRSPRTLDDSAVWLGVPAGSASGVVLKGGLILTAGHVAELADDKPFEVRLRSGELGRADVLWSSVGYDVALLHSSFAIQPYRDLACRELEIGEPITISGYPGGMQDTLITTRGVVSSKVGQWDANEWKEFVVTDAVGQPGMSGSGVLDKNGKLAGIFVGSFLDGRSKVIPTGFYSIVPAQTICKLLGR